ncbi:MAG: AI-2E family transporter [Nitrosopumilus sp.]|nr:AI-2E family transporter [Nitrosopumilus sp.]
MNIKKNNSNLVFPFYRALGITVLTIILLLVAWFAIDVWLLTFAGILLAIFLRTLNSFIKRIIHLSDKWSMTLVLGILAITLISIIGLLTPLISEQIDNLFIEIPNAWSKLQQSLSSFFNIKSISSIYHDSDLYQFFSQRKNILIQTANLFSTTFGILGSIVVFLFIGIFLAYDPHTYQQGFMKLIPSNKRKKANALFENLTLTLRWWIIGKLISMIIVGILTSLGLWMLNIPLALTLGLLAAILTFIPNIGPILSAIPAILMAVIQSPVIAFYVIILYIIIQTVESFLITPIIQEKTISLPPVLIIITQLLMALFTGILGLALATPLLAVLSVLVKRLYIEKELN